MVKLMISLLGSFQVTLDGEPVTGFTTDKARALLAYLAVEADSPQRRDALAGLLWPDQSQRKARQNLRQALSHLRAGRSATRTRLCHSCWSAVRQSSSTPPATIGWT